MEGDGEEGAEPETGESKFVFADGSRYGANRYDLYADASACAPHASRLSIIPRASRMPIIPCCRWCVGEEGWGDDAARPRTFRRRRFRRADI